MVHQNYYKLSDAINSQVKSPRPFIIANEYQAKGHVGRVYSVCESFKYFILNRDLFPNAHEILADHAKIEPNLAGRLVFDFDIKMDTNEFPHNFQSQVEETILDTIEIYMNNVDFEKIKFIWSYSENPDKISKHLTVQNLCFDNWMKLSPVFYHLFGKTWEKNQSWIKPKDLIDYQIIRKNGSLRMTGSAKLNGSILTLDNPDHSILDSLIRLYTKRLRDREQIVNINNFNQGVIELVQEEYPTMSPKPEKPSFNQLHKTEPNLNSQDPIVLQSLKLLEKLQPKTFKFNKTHGQMINLLRLKPNYCLLSGNKHENENAYLTMRLMDDPLVTKYRIYFCCYRKCYKFKSVYLGSVIGQEIYPSSVLMKKQNRVKKLGETCLPYSEN